MRSHMRISSALWALFLPLITALPALAQEPEQNSWIQGRLSELDSILGGTVGFLASILLFDLGTGVPFIVGVLLIGGIYYTLFFGFFSIRAFGHSIDVVRGLYDDPDDPGEISHFKALTSALSATIGLGNIAGVAVAIGTGGPGALVWMIITAIFGMSSKLASCTLAIMYRDIHPDGRVTGGPMYHIEKGLELKGLKALGRGLAILFALLCIGGSLGGGNMFQSNQTLEALGTLSPFFKEHNWLIGMIPSRLGRHRHNRRYTPHSRCDLSVGARYVPAVRRECPIHYPVEYWTVPAMFALVISQAFSGDAVYGGVLGIMVTGITRAAFSNEAGIGSAAIAHSAAKTEEAAREGIVAMIGPFIDTIVICTMTALVVMLTGVYQDPALQGKGAEMTATAFGSVIPGAEYVLAIVICLFAYSTMISWEYYGERAWEYLFGTGSMIVFRLLFVFFVFVGAVTQLENVINFSDLMILSMAFPNIIGGILLSRQIKERLNEYWDRLQSGQMKRYK